MFAQNNGKCADLRNHWMIDPTSKLNLQFNTIKKLINLTMYRNWIVKATTKENNHYITVPSLSQNVLNHATVTGTVEKRTITHQDYVQNSDNINSSQMHFHHKIFTQVNISWPLALLQAIHENFWHFHHSPMNTHRWNYETETIFECLVSINHYYTNISN